MPGAAGVVRPGNDKSAVGKRSDRWLVLVAGGRGVDLELVSDRDIIAVEALPENPGQIAVLSLPGIPGDDIAADRKRRHRWMLLVGIRIRIDLELGPDGLPKGVIPLAVNAVSVAVLETGFPGDDEPAVQKSGDRRFLLRVVRRRIDLELAGVDEDRVTHRISETVAAVEIRPRRVSVGTIGFDHDRPVRRAGGEGIGQCVAFTVRAQERAADGRIFIR